MGTRLLRSLLAKGVVDAWLPLREPRAVFRVPSVHVHLLPGSHCLESGWVSPDGKIQPTDGHVTKTRKTAGGTVAHISTLLRRLAMTLLILRKSRSNYYTEAMWAAQKSEAFWKSAVVT